MMRRLFFVFAILATQTLAQTNPDSILPGAPCHGQTPCALDGREYHVKEPDGWDGISPLPVMLHFHGWGRTGAVPVYHGRISGATRRRGVLLLAPTGRNRTWDFYREGSADIAFARAVLADAAQRYPIDPHNIIVSGYSYGGLMAWRYACASGDGTIATLSISAALTRISDCDQAPDEIRVVYGLRDNVLDFPFGPGGDTSHPVKVWRDHYGCTDPAPDADYTITGNRTFTRRAWECGAQAVILDIHPGGHLIPRGWIARQLDELLGLTPASP